MKKIVCNYSVIRFIPYVETEEFVKSMQALFNHYVDRHFAKRWDYQEKIMTDRLTTLFKAKNLLTRYHQEQVG